MSGYKEKATSTVSIETQSLEDKISYFQIHTCNEKILFL
jgi:hypothetical protein